MQIPVNRWTMGALLAAVAIWGGDFLAPLMKAIAILSAPYVPAI